ncbi:hypothetical protein FVR03_15180 [Pontibacter qinzhouensis]|uniref:Uncharacterized protein n=1 Tax=Pontibacter qinzhouensis TaxID=2603253 RepID=A0A5C8JGY3_9BACT|nr:hypothetical protein [Pontibacter qinzhouensis]TXK37580.1 hypothetical protein FVR03_15180 [Pontibacter qinzhouensis]
MMNFLLVITYIIPILLVIGVIVWFLVKLDEHLKNMRQIKMLGVRLSKDAITLPVRLHAYERVVLLLERITPANMLLRISSSGFTAAEYHQVLLSEIRNEFNHNMSQQVYMSDVAWQQVKQTREEVVNMVNRTYHELPEGARGTDLAKRILESILVSDVDPTAAAIQAVKQELREVF